ncbi:MAG: fibrobacter succinogenes major paralogous domain-containing protein [Dysgonamonadaceae bacterium]|jgi:hypothetical protein|nr:fibrobacter succinogenes major paralogous domain-containing protein [Dysgonamonadaceae bacterium]
MKTNKEREKALCSSLNRVLPADAGSRDSRQGGIYSDLEPEAGRNNRQRLFGKRRYLSFVVEKKTINNLSEVTEEIGAGRCARLLPAAQWLTVAAILMLWSCIREVGEGTGEKVEVRFSSREMAYGADETVTRSSSGGARVLETVEIPVDGKWTISADLMDDGASPLRAVPDGLVNGAKVLIVIYNSSGNYVNHATYTFNSTTADLSGGGLTVTTGSSYYFVACSYNSITAAPFYSAVMTGIAPTNDLLWGKTGLIPIASADQKIDIGVSHLFMKIKLYATTVGGGYYPNLRNLSASLTTNYTARLTLSDGTLVKDAATTAYAFTANDPGSNLGTSPGGYEDQMLTSDYGIAYTGGDNPFYARINTLTLRDGSVDHHYVDLSVSFNSALQSGHSYTLQMNVKNGLAFAGSNIYWDGSKLTFKPNNYVGPENYYQGVFFRWGSLVGIAPVGEFGSSVRFYVPQYNSGSSPGWSMSVNSYSWTNVPYYKYPIVDSGSAVATTPYLSHDSINDTWHWNSLQGDICRYISENGYGPGGRYRLPALREFAGLNATLSDAFITYNWGASAEAMGWYRGSGNFHDLSVTGSTNDVTGGRFDMRDGNTAGLPLYHNILAFPASGYRYTDDGALQSVGASGYYWSGSRSFANENTNGNRFFFESASIVFGSGWPRTFGFSVRCIKD